MTEPSGDEGASVAKEAKPAPFIYEPIADTDRWKLNLLFPWAWERFIRHAPLFVLGIVAMIVCGILSYVLGLLFGLVGGLIIGDWAFVLGVVLGYLIGFVGWLTCVLGLMRMSVKVSVDAVPVFSDLYACWAQTWKLFVASLILSLVGIFLPALIQFLLSYVLPDSVNMVIFLFLFPALNLYLTSRFIFTGLILADEEYGPLEAMRSSWNHTESYVGRILLILVLLLLFNAAGVLLCGLGLFVTAPMSLLIWAKIYRDTITA